MTPAARVASAVDILERVLTGAPAEQALTNWARASRYAGSKDRAAVRDHVFDALRNRRSFAWLGGADTGRGVMIGALRAQGRDPAELFGADQYAPTALGPGDPPGRPLAEASEAVRADLQDWVLEALQRTYGPQAAEIAAVMRSRAPVGLRVNLAKATAEQAIKALAEAGLQASPHPLAETALVLKGQPRGLARSQAYLDGLIELQDPASQAVVAALPQASRALDYCAGGGGKSLALAALGTEVTAHDSAPDRMRDLPARAKRAGCAIRLASGRDLREGPPFDLVLCDVPCSGSGAWRRNPDGKWRLTRATLQELTRTQATILAQASGLVAPGGALAYVTCSLLEAENMSTVSKFLEGTSAWELAASRQLTPLDGGDGFFHAVLRRKA